jgi:autoinducer 2-degrading protein
MHIVLVHVHVKPESIQPFIAATLENARNAVDEPGVGRFDFLQMQDDPTRFILAEIYHTVEGAAQHKETSHYQKWRDSVAEMMAEPRMGIQYTNLFPDDQGW